MIWLGQLRVVQQSKGSLYLKLEVPSFKSSESGNTTLIVFLENNKVLYHLTCLIKITVNEQKDIIVDVAENFDPFFFQLKRFMSFFVVLIFYRANVARESFPQITTL